ncbi:LOW QUALITY PROTEIN: olfactory receptor class A-like protein 4 [Phoenicopterus ruber ruber]
MGAPLQTSVMVCNPTSIFIYVLAFTSTIGHLIVLFAFISNAIHHKVLQPLDRIVVNMALVNLLCCYEEVPAVLSFAGTSVFGERGCRILLHTYHMLRLISIWSAENLSFLHLIKIHRPNHHWSKFIYRHQGQYVNSILAGCWIFSIIFQLPYLQCNTTAERVSNESVVCLATSTRLSSPGSFIMKFTTYAPVSLDLTFMILVIVLNGFIVDLLWRQKRKIKSAPNTGSTWNKHTAQVTKILLSLLSIYIVCWLSNDITWIALVSGLLKQNFENSIFRGLYGVLSCIYYSSSSYVIVFGYKKVRQYLTEACWGLRCEKPTVVQSMEM